MSIHAENLRLRWRRLGSWICIAIGAGALIAYAAFIGPRALNVPFQDDLYDILRFVMLVEDAPDVRSKIARFFVRHNEHLTAASRLVYWLAYRVQGVVDFRMLTWLANLFVPLLVALYSVASRRADRAFAFALCALLLCQPRGALMLLWPMAAFAFFGTLSYGIASLLTLRRLSPHRFALALVLACASMLSLSSGLAIWPVGAAVIGIAVWQRVPNAVRYLMVWVVAAAVAITLYQRGLHIVTLSGQAQPPSRLLAWLATTPVHHAGFFIAMTGSAFAFGSPVAALAAGCMVLALLPVLSAGALRRGEFALTALVGFLVLSIALVALGRAPFFELSYAFDPRYSIASICLITAIALLADQAGGSRAAVRALSLSLALACLIASYRFYTPEVEAVLRQRVSVFNNGNYEFVFHPLTVTNALAGEAVRRGFYDPPERPVSDSFPPMLPHSAE